MQAAVITDLAGAGGHKSCRKRAVSGRQREVSMLSQRLCAVSCKFFACNELHRNTSGAFSGQRGERCTLVLPSHCPGVCPWLLVHTRQADTIRSKRYNPSKHQTPACKCVHISFCTISCTSGSTSWPQHGDRMQENVTSRHGSPGTQQYTLVHLQDEAGERWNCII